MRGTATPVDTWRYLDAVAFAFPFGWIFGRLGCFVAFDHPGLPTDFFLGMENREGEVIHNLGLEEAIFTVALSAVFALLARRPRFAGFYLGLLPLVYAPYRFASDFLRGARRPLPGADPGPVGHAGAAGAGRGHPGRCGKRRASPAAGRRVTRACRVATRRLRRAPGVSGASDIVVPGRAGR